MFQMQCKELVMGINIQTHSVLLDVMTKFNELIDKSLKMAFHIVEIFF